MDADGWSMQDINLNSFRDRTSNLCKAFAEVIKKMCTTKEETTSLEAFLACRLIPLDKNPGLRPIGVGDILRRIAGKVVIGALKNGIISSVG